MKREVLMGKAERAVVDLNTPVARFSKNPILTARQVNQVWIRPEHQVITVHNSGVAIQSGETVLLFRSHLRCGLSVLGTAWSGNGFTDWRVASLPAMLPAGPEDSFGTGCNKEALIENEAGGVEDPRITKIGDTWFITYSAYHARVPNRVRVSLATTRDFATFTRWGPILDRDMRNVVIFPEKVKGKYVGLFRPNDSTGGDVGGVYTQIRIGFADDLYANRWEILKEPIMQTGGGPSAFSSKIGPGAPPIRTSRGWLNIFHGVRTTMDGNPYVLGVALHDLEDPTKIKVAGVPILFPTRADCRLDDSDYVHVPQVVFTCGAIRRQDGSIVIYYGGSDTVMNLGVSHEDVLIELCERYGQDPTTGTLLYPLR